jgi:hypothetical protein
MYCDILVTLDMVASKIRIKQGQLTDTDIPQLRRSIASLNYLWGLAGLSFTPKIQGVLAHAADQVEFFGGIGDLLEDDLEHLHQMSQRISYRTGRIKSTTQQAISHSKMEAKVNVNNKEIVNKTKESKKESMRVFKKARTGSIKRAAQAKIERDNSRIETLVEVERKPHSKIVSFYESEKARLLVDNSTSN